MLPSVASQSVANTIRNVVEIVVKGLLYRSGNES
jgi:hypothetical protein